MRKDRDGFIIWESNERRVIYFLIKKRLQWTSFTEIQSRFSRTSSANFISEQSLRQVISILVSTDIIIKKDNLYLLKELDLIEKEIIRLMLHEDKAYNQIHKTNIRVPLTAKQIADLVNKMFAHNPSISPMTIMDKLKHLHAQYRILIAKKGAYRKKIIDGKPYLYPAYIKFVLNM